MKTFTITLLLLAAVATRAVHYVPAGFYEYVGALGATAFGLAIGVACVGLAFLAERVLP